MDEIWAPVIGCLGFTILIVTPFIVNKLIKFRLEIAKINAETTIRTEEIRAKNQFEIEKLMGQEGKRQGQETTISRIGNFREEELLNDPTNSRVSTRQR
jgi:hypothetical protein